MKTQLTDRCVNQDTEAPSHHGEFHTTNSRSHFISREMDSKKQKKYHYCSNQHWHQSFTQRNDPHARNERHITSTCDFDLEDMIQLFGIGMRGNLTRESKRNYRFMSISSVALLLLSSYSSIRLSKNARQKTTA